MASIARGYRTRGVAQLLLTVFGQSIGFAGFILTSLFRDNILPANWIAAAVCWYGLGIVSNIGVRIALPHADPIILPIVLTITGLGLAMLQRIDLTSGEPPMLGTQFLAVTIGVGCLLIIAFLLKDPHRLKGYPFLLSAAGFVLLLLPLIPGLGYEQYGSRIWISLGSLTFQPAEIAKLVLAASFAAYLADKREVLSSAGHRILRFEIPRMRDLGPVMVMWGLSLAIMVFENDLGTSLLFFGLFVMMIYVATGRVFWVILGLGLFAAGGAAVLRYAGHVQRRIDFWLRPFDYPDNATQIIQAQFGLSHGGLFGSGWGLGQPDLIILAQSDMIAAAVGEEIGIVGLMAVVVLYGLFVFRGLKVALVAMDTFSKLLAAGLSFAFLLQVFTIIGGVTRLLPLTGLTTPFLSQGGSSMIANWLLVAGLLVVSNQARRPQADPAATHNHGVTDLEEEHTQVFTSRELAQIGTGAIHPIQKLDVEQVRLGPGGMAPAGDAGAASVPGGSTPGSGTPGSGAPGAYDPSSTQPFDPFADEEETALIWEPWTGTPGAASGTTASGAGPSTAPFTTPTSPASSDIPSGSGAHGSPASPTTPETPAAPPTPDPRAGYEDTITGDPFANDDFGDELFERGSE